MNTGFPNTLSAVTVFNTTMFTNLQCLNEANLMATFLDQLKFLVGSEKADLSPKLTTVVILFPDVDACPIELNGFSS